MHIATGSRGYVLGLAGGLSASVNGSTVTLQWTVGAGPTSSYLVEAGSSSGAANLASFDTGSPATSLVAVGVGSGTYFVRVKSTNACGTSAASNEIAVLVQ